MATNDFKSFATGSGANVMSQADYLALSALLTGFQSGKAASAQVNKAIRQATTIAALVGQFIANANIDALDNGDVSGLVTKFTNALNANLNLKTAAQRDVGESTNQIPDMASFVASFGNNGYQKLPGGLILQWGQNSMPGPGATNSVTFPIAFPSAVYSLLITTNATGGASTGIAPCSTSVVSKTGFQWVRFAGSDYTSYGTGYWFAIGR